jgi:hypothetical protein
MWGLRRISFVAVLLMIVAGCATSPAPPPIGAEAPAPELGGLWTGTWAGTPVSLSLIQDEKASSPSGVYVGSWLVLGRARPAFSGIITFSRRGEMVSTRAQAWASYSGGGAKGGVTLLVQSAPTDGDQELRLRSVDGQRLVGTGYSSFPWGPQGAVELQRNAR